MSESIQAVFFDGAGTLFRVRGSVGAIYLRVAQRHCTDVDVADLDAAFKEYFESASPMRFHARTSDRLHQMETQWWYDVVYKVFSRLDIPLDFHEYRRDIYEYFRTGEAWELYPETRDALLALRERGYLLAVVSNFDSRLPDLLADLGIADLFASVTFATPHGVTKPDRALFEIALRRHSLDPARVVHVGDHMEEDVLGGRAAGLRPVLINRDGGRLSTIDLPAIRRLDQLLELLPERAGG